MREIRDTIRVSVVEGLSLLLAFTSNDLDGCLQTCLLCDGPAALTVHCLSVPCRRAIMLSGLVMRWRARGVFLSNGWPE